MPQLLSIAAMLRVKNAKLTIQDCLKSLSLLVDSIVIVDNGSTDGTDRLYSRFPKITEIKKTIGFDEGRDRNLAHMLAKKLHPDWIIVLDADEVFEPALNRKRLEKWCRETTADCLGVRNFHFWLSKTHFRTDPRFLQYTSWPQPRIFRNLSYMHFSKVKFHAKFVCGYKKMIDLPYRLKHFGYIDRQQIKNKLKLYKSLSYLKNQKDLTPFEIRYPKIQLSQWYDAPKIGTEIYLKILRWYWRAQQWFNPLQRPETLIRLKKLCKFP